MRILQFLAVSAAAILASDALHAESTSDALKTFGLTGRWTFDCAYNDGEIYEAPLLGTPKFREIGLTGRTQTTRNNTIKSAERLTEEKIRLISVLSGGTKTSNGVTEDLPLSEPAFISIIQKAGNKIVLTDRYSEDKKIIIYMNGDVYIPKLPMPANPGDRVYVPAGVKHQTWEKCLS
jgi:hypothetical protein